MKIFQKNLLLNTLTKQTFPLCAVTQRFFSFQQEESVHNKYTNQQKPNLEVTTDEIKSSKNEGKVIDKQKSKQEYDQFFKYAQENLVYKCGNYKDLSSRFGFIKRWRLEKQLNYNNCKHPIFLYAYRAFIDALGQQDKKTLQKMCEKSLYKKLDENFRIMNSHNCEYFTVAENIKMKMKLLDTRIIDGIYLDRSKNLSSNYYDVVEKKEKTTYSRKVKVQQGKIQTVDFEVLMKDRTPQGINTGYQSPYAQQQQSNQQNSQQQQQKIDPAQIYGQQALHEDMSIIQLDLQFSSNLRLGIRHTEDKQLILGIPPDYNKEYEVHSLRFERYVKLPQDLRVLRDKMQRDAMNDPKKIQQMKDEEILNPWLITDLDYSLDGNPFTIDTKSK